MRRLVAILGVFLLVLILTSCEEEETVLAITKESIITMENLDDYMGRNDVQYIDLRNFSDPFLSGTIEGFVNIPFFDYLDYRAFDRLGEYDFEPDQLLNEELLLNLFDPDKAIFLFADGCIRSGYIKDALNYLGYERVFVLGGFYEYRGEYLTIGDGSFVYGSTFYYHYLDPITSYTYMMYGEMDVAHNITSIRFDLLDEQGNTVRGNQTRLEFNYENELTILETYVLENTGNFEEHLDRILHPESSGYNAIEGYTLGFPEALISLFETAFREML